MKSALVNSVCNVQVTFARDNYREVAKNLEAFLMSRKKKTNARKDASRTQEAMKKLRSDANAPLS